MSLLGSKTFIEKSTSKYIEKQGNIEAKEIKDKRLNEIAPLLAQKLSQAEISRRLGIPRSTMADRCKIIRNKYPHLLEAPSGQIPFSNPDDSDKTPMEE
jgi:predicted XRE-type DNA-binding protein